MLKCRKRDLKETIIHDRKQQRFLPRYERARLSQRGVKIYHRQSDAGERYRTQESERPRQVHLICRVQLHAHHVIRLLPSLQASRCDHGSMMIRRARWYRHMNRAHTQETLKDRLWNHE